MFATALVAGLMAVSAFAADVSGKWTGEMPGRGGQARPVTLTLKADGGSLSGTMGGGQNEAPISDGKVDGDNVSFKVVREFNGNSMTMLYKGMVSGDDLKLTVTREGGEGQSREVTLKRAK
jgi:hypothetical protein